jgi:hypothetical protein
MAYARVRARAPCALSVEEFAEHHLAPSVPVLISGLARSWPALALWRRPEYLESVCGAERAVLCERNEGGRLFSYGSTDASVTLPLREVLATYRRGGPEAEQLYAAQTPIDELQPNGRLREDLVVPPYCALAAPADWRQPSSLLAAMLPVRPPPDVHLWLGHTTSVSPLHFDAKHNLLTQIVGHKRVCLFPPECGGALYASSNQSQLGTAGLLDLRLDGDGEGGARRRSEVESVRARWPRFVSEALPNMLVCEIGPGDALYIPSGWWHHVQAIAAMPMPMPMPGPSGGGGGGSSDPAADANSACDGDGGGGGGGGGDCATAATGTRRRRQQQEQQQPKAQLGEAAHGHESGGSQAPPAPAPPLPLVQAKDSDSDSDSDSGCVLSVNFWWV